MFWGAEWWKSMGERYLVRQRSLNIHRTSYKKFHVNISFRKNSRSIFSKKFEKPWRPVAGHWPPRFFGFFWKIIPKLIRIQFFEKPFCQISKDYHFLSFPIKFEFFDYLHHSKLSFLWTTGRPVAGHWPEPKNSFWHFCDESTSCVAQMAF